MVLVQKASALTINKQFLEAVSVYGELVKIKPRYEKGWVGMANIFLLQGDHQSARMVAQKGLSYLPDSQALKAILK